MESAFSKYQKRRRKKVVAKGRSACGYTHTYHHWHYIFPVYTMAVASCNGEMETPSFFCLIHNSIRCHLNIQTSYGFPFSSASLCMRVYWDATNGRWESSETHKLKVLIIAHFSFICLSIPFLPSLRFASDKFSHISVFRTPSCVALSPL